MGLEEREYLEKQFDRLHEKIDGVRDATATAHLQVSKAVSSLETTVETHGEEIKDIKGREWKSVGAIIVATAGFAIGLLKGGLK